MMPPAVAVTASRLVSMSSSLVLLFLLGPFVPQIALAVWADTGHSAATPTLSGDRHGASSGSAAARGPRLAVRGQAAPPGARLRDQRHHARRSRVAGAVRQGLRGVSRLRADPLSRRRSAAGDAGR